MQVLGVPFDAGAAQVHTGCDARRLGLLDMADTITVGGASVDVGKLMGLIREYGQARESAGRNLGANDRIGYHARLGEADSILGLMPDELAALFMDVSEMGLRVRPEDAAGHCDGCGDTASDLAPVVALHCGCCRDVRERVGFGG